MTTKKRIDTVRILVSGHPSLSGSTKLSAIVGELNRVAAATKVPKHNGWLLGVLHTTRALDTTLNEVLAHKSWLHPKDVSLGGYLKRLQAQAVLTAAERARWQRSIVDNRNRFMHTAGAMPTQLENDAMLSEMEACLAIILGKT